MLKFDRKQQNSVKQLSFKNKNVKKKNTGLGCHSLHQGNLPNPGIKLRTPALQVDPLPSEPPGKPAQRDDGLQMLFSS